MRQLHIKPLFNLATILGFTCYVTATIAGEWIPIYSPEPNLEKGESIYGYSADGRESFTVKTKDGGVLNVVNIGGYGYVGDMILGHTKTLKQQGLALDVSHTPIAYGLSSEFNSIQGTVRHVNSNYKWPNGVIPYVIDRSLGVQARQDFRYAIEHWHANTRIRLVPRTNQTDYINVQNGGGCSSWVGRSGGAQTLTLANNCGRGAAVHEIGHAIGLFHEQTRPDRDNYIRLLWNNISSNMAYNFQQISNYQGKAHGQYDYDSIMHYRINAFGVGGRTTIEILDPNVNEYNVGNGLRLSQGDIAAVEHLYGEQDPVEECIASSIENGQTVSLSAITGQSHCFKFVLPESAKSYEISTSASNGDADLFVRKGLAATQYSYDCKSDSEHSNENCSKLATAGNYYINVYAYKAFNDLQLHTKFELNGDKDPINDSCQAHELTPKSKVTLKNIAANTNMCFKVNATDEFELVKFTLAGGQGNADIYVKQGSLPNPQTYDCVSANQGNDEMCSLAARTAPFYIRVYANSVVSNTTLQVDLIKEDDSEVETYFGEISTPDEVDIQPNGQWFEYQGGTLIAQLAGNNQADLELSLEQWNNIEQQWKVVASSTQPQSDEQIEFQAPYGYYRFKVYSWDSQTAGQYQFTLNR